MPSGTRKINNVAREVSLEASLVSAVVRHAGKCIKLPSKFIVGLPDRMILLPGRRIYFLELKRAGERPTMIQAHWLEMLRQYGFPAEFVAGRKELNEWIGKNLT